MQHGLSRSSGLSGLSFWRGGIIAEEALIKAVSLVGSDQRALDVAADGAGVTAFRGMKSSQPAPLLNSVVIPTIWGM